MDNQLQNIGEGTQQPGLSLLGNDTVVKTLMRNVYVWMAAALVITGLTSLAICHSTSLLMLFAQTPALMWGALVAELVLVFALSFFVEKLSFTGATVLFILYAVLNGVSLAPIFMVYTGESIASVFLVTAGMFAVMAVVGTVIKKDLSGLGRFLLMALIGLILVSVVNLFLGSTGLSWGISVVGVLLFTGLTVYDAQKIKQMLAFYGDEVNDNTQKIALMGSLTLYLDFINIFLYLLRLFGRDN